MPNWSYNTLVVQGSPKEREKFKKFAKFKLRKKEMERMGITPSQAKKIVLDFNNFIPYPECFKMQDVARVRMTELNNKMSKGKTLTKNEKNEMATIVLQYGYEFSDGYNSGGWDWCCSHWGTKWNACELQPITELKGETLIEFDTAWQPPFPVILKMSEMFPKLTFTLNFEVEGEERGLESFTLKNGKEIKDED